MLKKLKVSTIWIIFGVALLITIGLVCLCPFVDDAWTKPVIVLLAIFLIFITLWIQYAAVRTFKFKKKLSSFKSKSYITTLDIEEVLKDNKFEARKTTYGISYLKIEGKNAFKVTLVKDNSKYFNQTEEENNGPTNKKLDKCEKFFAIEIFNNCNEDEKLRLTDFYLEGNKVYYNALDYNEGIYTCYNYKDVSNIHKENYEYLFNLLSLKEMEKVTK